MSVKVQVEIWIIRRKWEHDVGRMLSWYMSSPIIGYMFSTSKDSSTKVFYLLLPKMTLL